MLRTRVIPVLLVREGALVKTVRFGKFRYVGDPINVVRIFNDLEVDELVVLDITATKTGRGPDFELIAQLSLECFMPFAYGGGITTMQHAEQLLTQGVEKIVVNTAALETPRFVSELASRFGSQAIVVSVDVRRRKHGGYDAYVCSGERKIPKPLDQVLEDAQDAGELLVNSIDRDGTYAGYDTELLRHVADRVKLPVIACGGAGTVHDLGEGVRAGGASAVGAGSMFVFQGKGLGVLVNFPTQEELEAELGMGS
jgi:imidazole glycerol-phosphate synthase subunit HisF